MVSWIFSRVIELLFGTLYPAYASYKAVKTKNIREYVSRAAGEPFWGSSHPPGPMDDVLDRLRSLHGRGDLHRPAHLLVPLLLRGEDGLCHLAAVAVHAGGQPAVPPLRAPHAGPQGEGHRRLPGAHLGAQLRDPAALRQEGPQPGGHCLHPGGHQGPGRAGQAAPQFQHAGPALAARAGARALPGPAVPGGAGEPPAAPGSPLRERFGRGDVVGPAGVPPTAQIPVPQPEPEIPEEEPWKRGLFPAPAQPHRQESGSVGAGHLKIPGNFCQEVGEEFAAVASGGSCGCCVPRVAAASPGWLLSPQGGSCSPGHPCTVNPFHDLCGASRRGAQLILPSQTSHLGAGASPVGSGPSFFPHPVNTTLSTPLVPYSRHSRSPGSQEWCQSIVPVKAEPPAQAPPNTDQHPHT